MGAVANAATLARDQAFRDRALAALVYQARHVIGDPQSTAQGKAFASSVVRNPLSYSETAAWAMAADPAIASIGSSAASIPEGTLLDQVLAAWPYLAAIAAPYPA